MRSDHWPRRIVILNFTGMRENWGCQATSWEFAGFLKQVFGGNGSPDITMVPLPPRHLLDQFIDRLHGARIERILADPAPSTSDLDFLETLATWRFGDFVAAVKAADLVVFQGEGTLGRAEFVRGVRLLALPFLAKLRWAKPVIAANMSVYDAQGTAGPLLANVLGRFDVLAVREPVSLGYCRDIGLKKAVLCPDMAFLARCPEDSVAGAAAVPRGGCGYFCVTGSAALDHYPLEDYVNMIEEVAVEFALQPVILHAKPRDSAIRDLAHALWRRIRPASLSGTQCRGYRDLLPVLNNAAFVLGGRYHLSILAAAVGTPPILLPGNTHKTQGLARLIGAGMAVHDLAETGGLAWEVSQLMADRPARRAEIEAAVAGLRDHIGLFARLLVEGAERLRSGDRAALARLIAAPRYGALCPPAADIAIPSGHARLYTLAHSPKPRLRLRQVVTALRRPRLLAAALHRGLSLGANLKRYACDPV